MELTLIIEVPDDSGSPQDIAEAIVAEYNAQQASPRVEFVAAWWGGGQ